MASEMLNMVLAAEKAGEEAQAKAAERAESIVVKATADSENKIEESRLNAEKWASGIVNDYAQKAQNILKDAEQRATEQAEQIKNSAAKKQAAAVESVLNLIIGKQDN